MQPIIPRRNQHRLAALLPGAPFVSPLTALALVMLVPPLVLML